MNPFDPIKIGAKEFRNRMFMAPVKTGYGTTEGEITDRHIAYYSRRADGGVGSIIVEPLFIDPIGKEHPRQLGISNDRYINGLKKLTGAIHRSGAIAIAHINHAGRAANPKASKTQPEAPSEIPCPTTGATPVSMNEARIKTVINEYIASCRRSIKAGFDAIEIQFGLGYLIAQFISPRTNKRTDKYGGNLENRYRFAEEVLDGIKEIIGDNNIPLIARMSATEQVEDGLSLDDSFYLAKFLEGKGISALHIVSGSACDSPPWYYQHMSLPLGKNLEWAGKIKRKVNLPIIAAGRLGGPQDIRKAFGEGIVDGIALGRPLIADPDLPKKIAEGQDDEIIKCGACLQGCLMKVKSGEGLSCIINPEVGFEARTYGKVPEPKKVVVVGGGPAGMESALIAKRRGNNVVLFDKDDLGGQFKLSFLAPGKKMMERPFDSLINIVRKSDIDIRLNHKATVDDILSEKPDLVILATGAVPIIPPIPGLTNPLTGEDILTNRRNVGKRVLVIGGGMVGLETAEFLAERNHSVTVVELLDDIARDMEPITKKLLLMRIGRLGVKILTGTEVERFEGKTAVVSVGRKESNLGDFDSVVVAVGTKSVNDLEKPLKENGLEVRIVGDAKELGQVLGAVRSGYEAASDT